MELKRTYSESVSTRVFTLAELREALEKLTSDGWQLAELTLTTRDVVVNDPRRTMKGVVITGSRIGMRS